MTARALEPDYFKALYASDPDPWQFASSLYEDAKYTATLAALSQPRYASAVEIGCSIEMLTARLAANCAAPLGIDVDEVPLHLARQRCAALSNVEFAMQRLPDDAPAGQFELIMLSEVLYYFDPPQLGRLADVVRGMALPSATLMLVHRLGPPPDYPLTGDSAVAAFEFALPKADSMPLARTAEYRLDVLRMP